MGYSFESIDTMSVIKGSNGVGVTDEEEGADESEAGAEAGAEPEPGAEEPEQAPEVAAPAAKSIR